MGEIASRSITRPWTRWPASRLTLVHRFIFTADPAQSQGREATGAGTYVPKLGCFVLWTYQRRHRIL